MNGNPTCFERWLALDVMVSTCATALLASPDLSIGRRVAHRLVTCLAHSGDSALWLLIGGLLWYPFTESLPPQFAEGLPLWFAEGLPTEAYEKISAPETCREVGKQIILITLITGAISAVLKRLFHRARPKRDQSGALYLRADRHSFPSGHAVRVGTLMVILGGRMSGWGKMGLGLWAVAVCAARMMLGAHFASDVLIGLLIGMSIGAVYPMRGTR